MSSTAALGPPASPKNPCSPSPAIVVIVIVRVRDVDHAVGIHRHAARRVKGCACCRTAIARIVLPLNGNVYIADLNNQRIRSTSATVLMFANQIVGTQSAVQPVTVTNSGNAALTLSSVAPSSPSFALAPSGTCGVSFPVNVPASMSCTLDVVFDPATVGLINASFSVVNNAAGSPDFITVTGTGLQDGTTLALVSSQPVSNVNSTVTFTATITPTTPTTAPTPTGTVVFTDGATNLGSVNVSASAASFTTSTLTAGTHTIAATYSGDTLYAGSTANLTQKIIGPPNIQLVSSLNPSTPGANVTFTVTVSSSNGTPTGTVIFNDGSTVLSIALPLDGSGVAAFSTATLAAGHASDHCRLQRRCELHDCHVVNRLAARGGLHDRGHASFGQHQDRPLRELHDHHHAARRILIADHAAVCELAAVRLVRVRAGRSNAQRHGHHFETGNKN